LKDSASIEIACTFGDPASIGPEVGCKAISAFHSQHRYVKIHLFAPKSVISKDVIDLVELQDPENEQKFSPGKGDRDSGARALRDLDRAIAFVQAKPSRILVTGPLDKFLCAQTLPLFSGHTEYLQQKTNSASTTMLLAGEKLKVALVTTHLAIRDVAGKLTTDKILKTARHANDYFGRFSARPSLAILGLNPHASDHGLFGDEEVRVIEPAIRQLRAEGIDASGPFAADSFFHRAGDFDVVIAMFHDQGLIPLKMIHFYDAVNITLGLPFLRVSVDHGTAFDIAGTGKASNLSYVNALTTAYFFAKKSRPD
jgi:4-hydroxythreonine-4-phosphate dehydrogenase